VTKGVQESGQEAGHRNKSLVELEKVGKSHTRKLKESENRKSRPVTAGPPSPACWSAAISSLSHDPSLSTSRSSSAKSKHFSS
jgi:hypothetical protein